MPLKTMLYLPLDERPCNWLFPQMMTRGVAQLELLTPPQELLGRKKTPADLEGLWTFVEENFSRSSCAVSLPVPEPTSAAADRSGGAYSAPSHSRSSAG